MKTETKYNLPVGYFDFHKKQIYNFQFNRWHSLGFARYEDMQKVAHNINSFSDWKTTLVDLAETAEQENRLKNAAIYYRGAEFYITNQDPDKIKLYDKFITLFYQIFKKDGIKSYKIPYDSSYLHALQVPAKKKEKKGTIIMHGGFDSFVEEFYYIMRIFSDHGYEVIAYEGPGQGGTRRKYDLGWDEHWEKPTTTIIDYFKLNNVTIFGISMGGHLCLRAAAFEPRIKRVITSGGAHDYWQIMNIASRCMLKFFMHFENFTTRAMVKKMKKDEYHNWFAENSMFITKINNPFQASMNILNMNKENSQPHRITQDVLILSAKNDHFIPIKMHKKMIKALTNARSVKGIIYTKDTSAHNHCQIGNIPLVTTNILDWINEIK
jgi:alpha-beta hydrolase superfamily lysophospholipase